MILIKCEVKTKHNKNFFKKTEMMDKILIFVLFIKKILLFVITINILKESKLDMWKKFSRQKEKLPKTL